MSQPLLSLERVHRVFRVGSRLLPAVRDVSLDIHAGEVLCLVGESGCGKSTTGRLLAGLLEPSDGRVLFEGRPVNELDRASYRAYRRAVQIVHQDPYASLNPVRTIYKTLSAPLFRHRLVRSRVEAVARLRELLQLVGLTPPDEFLAKYPHQLSGGQRQRVSVARALTVNPRFIVADEAVSMVDVSIRVSLLNMLLELRQRLGTAILLITHDLALARYFAWQGRIAVMYLGRIVEIGPTPRVIGSPRHPYTQALLSAIPEADPELTRQKRRPALRSLDVPSLAALPAGCSFHPRCPLFEAGLCDRTEPELSWLSNQQGVSCHVAVRQALERGEVAPPAPARGGGSV